MTGQGSGKQMAAPKLTRKKLEALLRAEFPEMFDAESGYALEELWHGGCRVRRHFHRDSLRPGGTLSGATMMALADFAMYIAVLSIGWLPLAVTTNLSINFLKKPAPRDLVAEARLIKLGKRLAVVRSASGRTVPMTWWRTPPRPIPSQAERLNNTSK